MSNEYRAEVESLARESWWTAGKIFTRVALPLVALGVLISLVGSALGFLFKPAQVVDQVTDPTRMIQQYERYHTLFNEYQANVGKIEDAQANLHDREVTHQGADSAAEEEEHDRLASVVAGLKNTGRDIAAQYNAESEQGTRAFLKSKGLPERLGASQ